MRYVWYQGWLAEVEHSTARLATIRLIRDNTSLCVEWSELEPLTQEDLATMAEVFDI